MGSLLLLDGESSSTSFLNNLIMCFLNEVHKSWAHCFFTMVVELSLDVYFQQSNELDLVVVLGIGFPVSTSTHQQ